MSFGIDGSFQLVAVFPPREGMGGVGVEWGEEHASRHEDFKMLDSRDNSRVLTIGEMYITGPYLETPLLAIV